MSLSKKKKKKKEKKALFPVTQLTSFFFYLNLNCLQFSSFPWPVGSLGDLRGMIQQRSFSSHFCRRPLWASLAWAQIMSILWCCPSSISSAYHGVAHIQGVLKFGFGEVVEACDLPEPCKFPSLDSYQQRFFWTHKGVDLALHRVVGLVLQVGDAEKFPRHLVSKAWILFSDRQGGSIFHGNRGGWRWRETCKLFYPLVNNKSAVEQMIQGVLVKERERLREREREREREKSMYVSVFLLFFAL